MPLIVSKFIGFLLNPLSFVICLFLLAFIALIFRRKGFSIFCTVFAVVFLVICSTPKLANYLTQSLQNQYPPIGIEETPKAKTIVVLGGVIGMPIAPRKQIELRENSDRVLHAARLFKAGKGEAIFVTGGNLSKRGQEKPEAYYIRELLIEWGVPAENIVFAGQSKTTRENALEVYQYLQSKDELNNSVILVTSASHMPRSVATFRKVGISVIPNPTDISAWSPLSSDFAYWLPSLGALASVSTSWREYLGLWYYRLQGWA